MAVMAIERDFEPVVARCRERHRELMETRPLTDAVRLFHGRGHTYPGFEDINVDRLGRHLLVGSFGGSAPANERLGRRLMTELSGIAGVCVQSREGRRTQTTVVAGEVPEQIVVTEAGLSFIVKPRRNQNVGLFLDMATVRHWVRMHADGRRVLNLFAYTCAFSVAALEGGAAGVVNVDMSRGALDWGADNHRQNGHRLPGRVWMLPHNVFRSWGKISRLGPYNLIIIDPPTNQQGSFNAEKQYGRVLKRLPELVAPGGGSGSASGAEIVACLNSPFLDPEFLINQMARWCPRGRFKEFLPGSADFPDRYPDRALKVARFVLSA